MTVGQVAAGSTAVEPKAAFAFAAGGLASTPKSELGFLETAAANQKPFSFHFRANSEAGLAEEGAAGRQRKQGEEALGAAAPDEESPDIPPPGADTALARAPLASTALKTARRIIAELQAPPRAPHDTDKTTADGHVTVGNRFAALHAPFGDLEKLRDVSQAPAFQKVASLLRAAMPRTTIEHAELGLLDSNGIAPSRIAEQGIGRTFLGPGASVASPNLPTPTSPPPTTPESQPNPVENLRAIATTEDAIPVNARAFTIRKTNVPNLGAAQPLGATIEHAELGLLDSNGIPPSRIVEQGLGRTFLGPGASVASPDLAASTSPPPATPEDQPNPVENLRAIAATEAAVPVNARAFTIRRTNITSAGGAQGLLPSRVLAFGSGRTTQHYREPNHTSRNQRSAKEVESIDQTTVAASPRSRLLHEVSHEEKSITNVLNIVYPTSKILLFNNPSERASGTEALPEQPPERKAEQANIPSTRPRFDWRLAHSGVPMGPQGKAPVKAASLPVSAAHFSLRPSETRGNEGIGAGSLSRRFSTSNPQTAATESPTGAESKAGVATPLRAPSSGGASRAEPPAPAQQAVPEVARHDEGRAPSAMGSKAPSASEVTRADTNLVSSSHAAAALPAVVRRERVERNEPSGTEFTRTQKGLDSPKQPESQPPLPEAPFSKRSASASRENVPGRSIRNGLSDTEKANPSYRIAAPVVRRPAGDTADPASQTLPRQAESSPRAPSVFSRPADPSAQALASYSERVRAVEHVVELASLQKTADLNQMNVVLRDSHLGRLSLRLVERNGVIDTLLRTDNSRTGQLIGESLPQMLEALSQKGFDVSHSGSEQWTGSPQEQRQGGRQRPPRPASRQGQKGPGAGHVFRLEIDS